MPATATIWGSAQTEVPFQSTVSHADRMCLHVVQGKGAKDRFVPLSPDTLPVARTWWQVARPRSWLFGTLRDADQPLDIGMAQRWYRRACAHAGITKRGGIHTLRHCYAIGNERLVGIDGDTVRLRVRADDHGGKRTLAIPGEQFIARLLQHVLPSGFKRIRHYGLLAPCAKTERLAQARRLLGMPAANPQAQEDARTFMKRVAGIEINTCPHCHGRWRVVEQRAADVLALRGGLLQSDAACRGPP